MKQINNEIELKQFLEKVGYFHDGVISEIKYISGSTGNKEGTKPIDDLAEIIMTIQGCWDIEVIMKFSLVEKAVIIPTKKGYTSNIFEGNIKIQNGKFIFSQDVSDINDEIKFVTSNGTTIASKELFYEIIPY